MSLVAAGGCNIFFASDVPVRHTMKSYLTLSIIFGCNIFEYILIFFTIFLTLTRKNEWQTISRKLIYNNQSYE